MTIRKHCGLEMGMNDVITRYGFEIVIDSYLLCSDPVVVFWMFMTDIQDCNESSPLVHDADGVVHRSLYMDSYA